MKINEFQFMDVGPEFSDFDAAAFAILPLPFEGGISYGAGTAQAPDAVIKASAYIELYDDILKAEPYKAGIVTLHPPKSHFHVDKLHEVIHEELEEIIQAKKFIVGIGGDHSITTPHFLALKKKYGDFSVIQIDAHADLRAEYEGSPHSHACVMARIREHTKQTLQLGIRSLSREEVDLVAAEKIDLVTMYAIRKGADWKALLDKLPDPVFITIDVDAFDWSVIASTGTPEPGGFLWHEALDLFDAIFAVRNVIGFDVVELSHAEHDRNSPVAAAKLIYHLIGLKIKYHLAKTGSDWPIAPAGPLFD